MRSLEAALLRPADLALERAVHRLLPGSSPLESRLSILEATSSIFGGWSLNDYVEMLGGHLPTGGLMALLRGAEDVLAALEKTEIPVPLALSALAREPLPASRMRQTGAYYTDWRLAQMLAASAVSKVRKPGLWVDPACGSGILLVASAMAASTASERDRLIRESLAGADLSEVALRGTRLSVSSLTGSLSAIEEFSSRLLLQDSLNSPDTWRALAPSGVALVIGNPPWEKLRASRHEYAKSLGIARHYGQAHDPAIDLSRVRQDLMDYVSGVASGTRLQGKGEHDLYKLFLELGLGLLGEDGVLAILVPAGLIRSKGTEELRQELDSLTTELTLAVIENRARYFAIDTRFKFLAMTARVGSEAKQPIELRVADRQGELSLPSVDIDRSRLKAIRPDLTIPEVRSEQEWALFSRLSDKSLNLGEGDGIWAADYRREVDMTLHRRFFHKVRGPGEVPVLEGRHVGQYRWRAKSYLSGEGRAAIWRPDPLATAEGKAQWFTPLESLPTESLRRVSMDRIGFCDVTGQTNERTLLVSRIPAGVVCGNKVPTLTFAQGPGREFIFLATANSFVVDWLLRRLVTTTVNYFLLKTLPLPDIDESSKVGKRLAHLSKLVQAAESDPGANLWRVGQLRAEIDALVAIEWGVGIEELEMILRDFPLLDRGQPALAGESVSTMTADVVLAKFSELIGLRHHSQVRVIEARKLGSLPYVPAEYVQEAS